MTGIEFKSRRAAVRFARGYCVDRVVAQLAPGRFEIVHPRTAARRRLTVVWSNA